MGSAEERLILSPKERRGAIAQVIGAAKQELRLSIFRCDDFSVLDALADAIDRKVRVRALLTPHAKNWRKRLNDLESFLESMGVEIQRYAGDEHKYHAKYIVADQDLALVASLNLTRKCLDETCDFILVSRHPELADSLCRLFDADWWASDFPSEITPRLIVGPDNARDRFLSLLSGAVSSVRIIDHRLSDPEILDLLRQKQSRGVAVQVLGSGLLRGALSHGRMMLIDESIAVVGSMALSEVSLSRRREVAVCIDSPESLLQLKELFDRFASKVSREKMELSEFLAVAESDDDD